MARSENGTRSDARLTFFGSTTDGQRKSVYRSVPLTIRVSLAAVFVGVLTSVGLLGWTLLGYAAIPTGFWVVALALLLWKRPQAFRQTASIWTALLIGIFAVAGLLSWYSIDSGGRVGDFIGDTSRMRGGAMIIAMFSLAVVTAAPNKSRRFFVALMLACLNFLNIGFRSLVPGIKSTYKHARFGHLLLSMGLGCLLRTYQRFALHAIILSFLGIAAKNLKNNFRRTKEKIRNRTELPLELQNWAPSTLGETEPVFITGPQVLDELSCTENDDTQETVQGSDMVEEPLDVAASVTTTEQRNLPPGVVDFGWRLPPHGILKMGEPAPFVEEENHKKADLIQQTLADYGIEVEVSEIRPGPVVTQFGLVPGWVRRYRDTQKRDDEGRLLRDESGRPAKFRTEEKTRVKVDNILQREKDLALALAARSIRFEAPVPGESFVGLEVPNEAPLVVTLRSVLESNVFQSLRGKARLPMALGQGSGGEPIVADLAEMPHLLIAGATGSGKSACINTILCSLLMQLTPMELRLFMVDPKRVELTVYNGIPHLLNPVLVDADKVVPALKSLISEMNRRYQRFEQARVRNLEAYNLKVVSPDLPLPYIVLVVDELADLMMTASADVEQSLCRLAQLGRATGIHLVLATQRPSVDVLTGLIKANFPSRVSFAVSSQIDSRTVLDGAGAEKLLGRGDMLFLPTNYIKPKRLQGTYIGDDEVGRLVAHWVGQRGPSQTSSVVLAEDVQDVVEEGEEDDLLRMAKELVQNHSRISASLLQRKLGAGYARASGLVDRLEELGLVEDGDPGTSRNVIRGVG
jgi:hypothetical protein